jgi:flagellar FliL protein
MAEAQDAAEEAPKKRSKLPLLIGVFLMLAMGGAGFFAAYSGLLPFGGEEHAAEEHVEPLPEVAFVPIPPLVITLAPESQSRYLRFTAELEVPKNYAGDVQGILPRVQDVLNSYLRAVDSRQFEDPGVLIRLRAQMLRRVQLVVGEGRVRDLLVIEFVLD